MSLLNVVDLYREVDCPPIENQIFHGELPMTPANLELIKLVFDECDGYGRFNEADQDGNDIVDDLSAAVNDHGAVTFQYRLFDNKAEKFYLTAEDILENCNKIKGGKLPDNFYLIAENIYHSVNESDEVNNDKIINQLNSICLLIRCLFKLAHYHDNKVIDRKNELVFLSSNGDVASPVILDIKLCKEMLSADLSDISLISSLLTEDAKLGAHYRAKLNVFSSSLLEFVKSGDSPADSFQKLTNNWGKFAEVYQRNLGTYLSGFAFHKAKKEVAEAEIKLAEQLANITSDITSKVFAIPISFAAITVMLVKKDGIWADASIVGGLLLAAIIIVGIVDNQRAKLQVVELSKDLLSTALEGKQAEYPEDLVKAISDMESSLTKNVDKAKKWLTRFEYFSLVPLYIGIGILFCKY